MPVGNCVSWNVSYHDGIQRPQIERALQLKATGYNVAINAVLHADFPQGDGLRVPGALDGFELAVRAVLGQQVTVAAARTLCCRLVQRLGTPVLTPWPEVNRIFPSAQDLLALGSTAGNVLGELGIVRQRQRAIMGLAQAVAEHGLGLHPGANVAHTLEALTALPGIGPWTAHYIAMRALRWSDAFPPGDVALLKALGVAGLPRAQALADARAQAWRPWRAYAVLRAWDSPLLPMARSLQHANPGGPP